jgi:hypothetical protein
MSYTAWIMRGNCDYGYVRWLLGMELLVPFHLFS